MSKQLAKTDSTALQTLDENIIANLVINGDLKSLSEGQKVQFYNYRCQQAGIDPSAKPFDLLTLNGKQILYANATCTQQLCANRGLSVSITNKEGINGIYMVWAKVTDMEGRSTENMGAVSIDGLKGESLSNALMKAHTKATRRTVLAHCGLGMLDETEAESIPGATKETINVTHEDVPKPLISDIQFAKLMERVASGDTEAADKAVITFNLTQAQKDTLSSVYLDKAAA